MVIQDYKGKWAVILGGSSGLGLATAQKLAKEGMHICIIHRDRRSVLELLATDVSEMKLQGVQVVTHNIDAMSTDKREVFIEDFVSAYGRNNIKVLVHSIARGNLKPFYSDQDTVKTLTHTDLMLTLDAMAVSLYDWSSAFAKANLFSKNARIITFTSEGSTKAWQQYGAVSAAKAALEAIIRNLALEFAPINITANAIQAGVTDTQSLRLIPGADVMKAESIKRNPYGRLTTPTDVANAVYLLCRDEANWINGTVIPVDGGEHIR